VPYAYFAVEGKWVFDELFHNLCWKIFSESKIHVKLAENYQRIHGKNMIVTGYPGCDPLRIGQQPKEIFWKTCDTDCRRIIWAPHHLKIKNFFLYADVFIDILKRRVGSIQIAFKPHPLLRAKLEKSENWGKKRTDDYYNLWDALPNGQFENSDYIDLFLSSDALIHDCGSFITEYLYTGKPCLFLFSDEVKNENYSDYGKMAIGLHYCAKEPRDVEAFIENVVINDNDIMKTKRMGFIADVIEPPNGRTASDNIFTELTSLIVKH
jgi:hypothetical protein